MAIDINGVYCDLNQIGRNESGQWPDFRKEEVKQLLSNAWQEIDRKFFSKNLPVVFRTPGIKSGMGKGSQGYSYPRSTWVKTKSQGRIRVSWYDTKETKDNVTEYKPAGKRIGMEEKTLTLGPNDIEEVLFMWLFNPNVVMPGGRMNGKTFLEDREMEAMKYEEAETAASAVSYFLFFKESPFYSDEDKIDKLCLAWGIDPSNKTITFRKQLLAEAVKKGEKNKELDFNFAAFNKRCEQLRDGNDTRELDTMALIQKAINRAVIKFDKDKIEWQLIGIDGNSLKTICKVPPQSIDKAKVVLRRHLIENPENVEYIKIGLDEPQAPSRHDRVKLKENLPEVVDEEYILNVMTWPTKKALYQYLGYDARAKTMADIHPVLIEHYVTKGLTVPFEFVEK
jgi:hypothetical protein